MVRARTARALASALLLCSASPAAALLDVPTSNRTALSIADLASSSGVAHPLDVSSMPFDDVAYAEAFHSLRTRGLVDPTGERVERRLDARGDGALHWEFFAPVLEIRPYFLDSDAGKRTLYHSSGDTLQDGFNTFLGASGSAFWGTHVGGAYELQAQQDPDGVSYRTKRLYVKGILGKWSLKVGRDSERLGPGYHGSLLLDDTALTFDMWRVRTEEPLFLPGPFASLGGFRFSMFNGYLKDGDPQAPDLRYDESRGRTEPVEDPRLLGMRLSYHPNSWLDLGASRMILYGGRSRTSYDSVSDWWKLLTTKDENVEPGESHKYDNDVLFSLDATARMPWLNGIGPFKAGKVYVEYGTGDRPQTRDITTNFPIKFYTVSYLIGGYFSTAVTDFRIEFSDIDDEWYKHHEYAQGYSYRGVPLGHHAGPDSRNYFFELSRYFGPAWRASVTLDMESRGRSEPQTEDRTEWGLALEARRFRLFDWELGGRLDTLFADVNAAWDDPARGDRTEYYVGLGVTVTPWEPERTLR